MENCSFEFVCIGVLVLTSAASFEILPSLLRFMLCTVGGALLLCSLVVLACISQDSARHSFGHAGFVCPFVPFLPVACILINTYLLVNLGGFTWIRVLIWLLAGELVYLFYGRTHSSLLNSIYVPTPYADEIYRTSSGHLM